MYLCSPGKGEVSVESYPSGMTPDSLKAHKVHNTTASTMCCKSLKLIDCLILANLVFLFFKAITRINCVSIDARSESWGRLKRSSVITELVVHGCIVCFLVIWDSRNERCHSWYWMSLVRLCIIEQHQHKGYISFLLIRLPKLPDLLVGQNGQPKQQERNTTLM